MERQEIIQAQHQFITTFQHLSLEDKMRFLNFNRYHHKRPIQDILSIFVQFPDARYLGTFESWKNYSTESSVQFGQKIGVQLYNKQGQLSEQLFDISQTTLHTVPKIHDITLSDRLLTNSLAELIGKSYFIGEEPKGQYFESISDYIDQYINESVPASALENYSLKQQQLALTLAKYNICEEFGAFLENSERYDAFLDKISTSIEEMDSEDNLLRTFALGNNYSKELSTQVYSLYEEVEKRTEHLIQEQEELNQELEGIESHLSFEVPNIFEEKDTIQELVTSSEPLSQDEAFLESVLTHFSLPEAFVIREGEYSTELVKEHFWGTEVLLSLDNGELEVSGAASGLTDIESFDKKVLHYYHDYRSQEIQKQPPLHEETQNIPLENFEELSSEELKEQLVEKYGAMTNPGASQKAFNDWVKLREEETRRNKVNDT